MDKISKLKQELGHKGEDIALKFLEEKGYKLVARNYNCPRWGELDLVMRDGKYLVFVEVRTKRNTVHGTPIESIDYSKRRQIEKMATTFFTKEKIPPETFCRFDVVGIVLPNNGEPVIEHIQDAFIAGD